MRTELCDRFGIDVPIFAFTHCRDVVVAVSKADNESRDSAAGEFNKLGFPTFPVSALHDRGFDDLMAPVTAGQALAEIKVSLDGNDLLHEQLRALDDNPSGSFWQRTIDGMKLWFE